MASFPSNSTTTPETQSITVSQTKPVQFFQSGAQISIKLSATNFFAWRRQVRSLLHDMKLFGYVDGTCPAPPMQFPGPDGTGTPNPAYDDWFCQDQLIVSLLLASMNERDSIALSACDTAHQLWKALESKYANPSRSHVMSLKNKLQRSKKGVLSITEFLFSVK